jgi:Tol biopolymer transport system component
MPSAARLSSGLFARQSGQPACLGSGPLDLFVSAISPDSARLFGLGAGAKHPQLEEYDTHTREFKPFLPNISAEYADFLRDGQWIAYVAGEMEITGPSRLWISRIDGSHKVQLTQPPLLVMLPRWSPDGRWIAFMGKIPGQPWRVRIVSVEGGSYAPVTSINNAEGAPTWSPDSNQLAFGGMTQPPERTTGRLVIHILNLKTHQISDVPGSEGLWTARWSPDGRYIAALTEDSRNLMLFDFRTTRWVKLATLAKIPDVAWSRHEAALYFNGEATTGDPAVFRIKVPNGQVERIASLKGRTDRDWLGLTPDDSPLVARFFGVPEVYALTVNWP